MAARSSTGCDARRARPRRRARAARWRRRCRRGLPGALPPPVPAAGAGAPARLQPAGARAPAGAGAARPRRAVPRRRRRAGSARSNSCSPISRAWCARQRGCMWAVAGAVRRCRWWRCSCCCSLTRNWSHAAVRARSRSPRWSACTTRPRRHALGRDSGTDLADVRLLHLEQHQHRLPHLRQRAAGRRRRDRGAGVQRHRASARRRPPAARSATAIRSGASSPAIRRSN